MKIRKGAPPKQIRLKRQLGLFDSSMVMVGIVIGSGIFVTAGIMAKYIPSAGLILLAWTAGGLLTLAGALTYAELGAAMPEAGGQYVYLREAYGPMAAFLFGWILYLYALPMNKIIGEVKIAEKATSALFGGSIGALISAVPIKHGGIPLSLSFLSWHHWEFF